MTNVKALAGGIISVILALIIIITIVGSTTDDVQTASESINIVGQCSSAGCFYNATATGSSQFLCANGTTAAAEPADSTVSCSTPTNTPLNGLFASDGIVILIFLAASLIAVIGIAFYKAKD